MTSRFQSKGERRLNFIGLLVIGAIVLITMCVTIYRDHLSDTDQIDAITGTAEIDSISERSSIEAYRRPPEEAITHNPIGDFDVQVERTPQKEGK